MKRFIAAALVALAALSAAAVAQNTDAEAEGRRLMDEGARAYKDGRFEEAQKFFEKALAADPAHKLAPLFIARAVQQQYKPGVDTPENVRKAEEAIEAYKRVLASDSADPKYKDDAFNAVAYLYRQMRDEASEEQWVLQRGNDLNAPADKRSDAYTVLASRQWNCSYGITEQPGNKETIDKKEQGVVSQYVRPQDQAEFEKAQNCIAEGLRLVEQAIELNRENPSAWSYKTNLLREMAKLAEMNGDPAGKAEYTQQADEAEKEQRRLNDQAKEQKAAGQQAHTGPDAAGEQPRLEDEVVPAPEQKLVTPAASNAAAAEEPPSATRATNTRRDAPVGGAAPAGPQVVKGGILNGKAVSKPAPAYPPEAKAARASGSVMVEVLIDETGKVESATAKSGHPLLRDAAVAAVRQWRFTPTKLAGRPVKITGNIVVNFAPQ